MIFLIFLQITHWVLTYLLSLEIINFSHTTSLTEKSQTTKYKEKKTQKAKKKINK